MFLPHLQAVIIELKLSSNNIISAASLATSEPLYPIANPTSALFNAGPSLLPSPVTATTLPKFISPVTNIYLSSGVALANTLNYFTTLLNISIFPILKLNLSSPTFSVIKPPTKSLNLFPSRHSY